MGTVSAEGGFFVRGGGFFVRQKKCRPARGGFFRKFFRHYVATKEKTPQPTSAEGFLPLRGV